MAAAGPELQFAKNLYDLIDLQNETFSKSYAKDLKEVTKLGVTLPKLSVPSNFKYSDEAESSKSLSTSNKSSDLVTVTLKSIKPPLKFQATLESSLSNTIYQLKEDLILSNTDFKGFSPLNFKFLVKGKVLNDSSFLKDYTDSDVSITVFATAPSPKPVTEDPKDDEPEVPVPVPQPTATLDSFPQLSNKVWQDFKAVLLQNNLNDEDSEKVLKKLRQNWEA